MSGPLITSIILVVAVLWLGTIEAVEARRKFKVWIWGATVLVAGMVAIVPFWLIPTLNERNITLWLQYAYEWNNYRGSVNDPDDVSKWSRPIIDPLRRKYTPEEIRLYVGIHNGNAKVPMEKVRFHMFFPEGLTIKPENNWQMMNPNREFFVGIGEILPNEGYLAGVLLAKFPTPGRYTVKTLIGGRDFGNIERPLEIILE